MIAGVSNTHRDVCCEQAHRTRAEAVVFTKEGEKVSSGAVPAATFIHGAK